MEAIFLNKHTYSLKDFSTKGDLSNHIRNLLLRYSEGETLSEPDFNFMKELLANHHSYATKVGCRGIASMQKIRTEYGNYGFQITRHDNSRTDFSWTACVTPRNNLYDIKKACRESIALDIQNYKSKIYELGLPICPITGKPVPRENAHIHHQDLSFDTIFAQWVHENNIIPSEIQIDGHQDGSSTRYFRDPDIAKNFRDYHNKKATLILLDKTAHLKLKKKAYD